MELPAAKRPTKDSKSPYTPSTNSGNDEQPITVDTVRNAVTLSDDQMETICNDIIATIIPIKYICENHGTSQQAFYKTIQTNEQAKKTYLEATNLRQYRAYETLFEKIKELDDTMQIHNSPSHKADTGKDSHVLWAKVNTLKTMMAELRWIASRNPFFSDKQTLGVISKDASNKNLPSNTDALKMIPQIDQALQGNEE